MSFVAAAPRCATKSPSVVAKDQPMSPTRGRRFLRGRATGVGAIDGRSDGTGVSPFRLLALLSPPNPPNMPTLSPIAALKLAGTTRKLRREGLFQPQEPGTHNEIRSQTWQDMGFILVPSSRPDSRALPAMIQTLNLQIPASLAAAGRNTPRATLLCYVQNEVRALPLEGV
jgi:hypothetical protein